MARHNQQHSRTVNIELGPHHAPPVTTVREVEVRFARQRGTVVARRHWSQSSPRNVHDVTPNTVRSIEELADFRARG